MIEIQYIIVLAMAITNVIKKRISKKNSDLIPFIALTIAIVANVLNALFFGGSIHTALKEALISAGISLTIFSSGSVIGRTVSKKE